MTLVGDSQPVVPASNRWKWIALIAAGLILSAFMLRRFVFRP
jgi:hypothetical protein